MPSAQRSRRASSPVMPSNALLGKAKDGLEIPKADLPDAGRSAAVSAWLDGKKTDSGGQIVISKPDVAQAILNERGQAASAAREQSTGSVVRE